MSLGAGANAAYRALQRACRRADERPERLVALLARPPRLFVPRAGKPLRLAPPRWPFVEDALYDAIGGSTEFAHPKPPGCRAAAASARRHRARVEALGAEYPPEAAEVLRRLGEAALVEAEASAAAAAERPAAGEAGSPEEADAVELPALRRLPPTDASRVDVGDILVAHPLACLQQPELTQSVMLVICVDDSSNHVRAVALNTPPRGSLRTLLASIPFSDADKQALERLGPLLDLHASPGGDLSSRKLGMHLHWLHGLGPAAATGCHEVLPSVWLGGEPAPQMAASIPAAAGAPAGSTPTRLRPVVGYAGWSRAQLAVELERGVWARCRAESPEAARALCLPGSLPRVAASAPGWQACAWRAALRAAGLQPLANFPRGGGADAPLIKLLHAHRKTMFETEVAAAQQAAAL